MSTGSYFMQRASIGDDRYACSYCRQSYPSQRDLNIHEYMHGNYVMEGIFDLAVQPRISYMTYDYFTYECRGMVSGVFGIETGCALTPEQEYEDEKNESYSGNNELLSTNQSPIHIYQSKSQLNNKFVSQSLMPNFTSANRQQSSPSYTPRNPPLGASYTPRIPAPGTSYTPRISAPGPSYTPRIPAPRPSYTPRIPPSGSSYTPPIQPLGPSYTPPIQPLGPSYTPPIQPLGPSYTPPIEPLGPSHTSTNPPTKEFGLIPLPDQHNADRRERPSMKLRENKLSEKTAATANADLTIKCQTSFLSPADQKSNPKTFCNEINRCNSSCRTEHSFTIGSGSNGPCIS